jgi:four helix bundle protein
LGVGGCGLGVGGWGLGVVSFKLFKKLFKMAIGKFEELEIWQMARMQVINIQKITFNINPDIARQIQRSSASVTDNIAEGFARGGRKEFKSFLIIAKGSNAEVRSQFYRMSDIENIPGMNIQELIKTNDLLGKRLSALISYLKKSERTGPNY